MRDHYLMCITHPDPEIQILLLSSVGIESNECKATDNVMKSTIDDNKTGGES